MWPNPQETVGLVTFTGENLKLNDIRIFSKTLMWNMCKNKSKNLQQKIKREISYEAATIIIFYTFTSIWYLWYVNMDVIIFFSNIEIKWWSSHRRCPVKKGVLGNFTKFTGKKMCQRLFFIMTQVFSCEYCETSKSTFLQNTSRQLLLKWWSNMM